MPRPSADTYDDERDDRPRRKPKPGSKAWLWITLGCSGVMLLGCIIGGGVIAIWIGTRSSANAMPPDTRITNMPGLLAYWSFDQVDGNRVIDHSGHNNDLTLVGGARTDTAGVRGKGLALDGTRTQYAEIPASNDFNFANNAAFTFAGWFRTPQNRACILSLTSTRGNQQIDMLVRDSRFICVVGDDTDFNSKGNAYVWSRPNIHNDGQWHHFAVTRSGNAINLWIDGADHGQMAAANSGGAVTTELRAIGSERVWIVKNDQRWGNPGFEGTIDEVCVFNRVLGQAEIQTLFGH